MGTIGKIHTTVDTTDVALFLRNVSEIVKDPTKKVSPNAVHAFSPGLPA